MPSSHGQQETFLKHCAHLRVPFGDSTNVAVGGFSESPSSKYIDAARHHAWWLRTGAWVAPTWAQHICGWKSRQWPGLALLSEHGLGCLLAKWRSARRIRRSGVTLCWCHDTLLFVELRHGVTRSRFKVNGCAGEEWLCGKWVMYFLSLSLHFFAPLDGFPW